MVQILPLFTYFIKWNTPPPPHHTYLRLSSQACRTGVSKIIQDINNPFCTESQEREIESVWWEHEVRCINHYDSGGDSIVLGIIPFPPPPPLLPLPPPTPPHKHLLGSRSPPVLLRSQSQASNKSNEGRKRGLLLLSSVLLQCCFASTETVRTIMDGESRTATSTFTQLLSSVLLCVVVEVLLDVHRNRRFIRDGSRTPRLARP